MPLPKIVAMYEAPFPKKKYINKFCIQLPININQIASIITHSHLQLVASSISLYPFSVLAPHVLKMASKLSVVAFSLVLIFLFLVENHVSLCVCVCMPFNSLTKARSIHQTACIQFYLSSFS